ncbi:MAG: amidohydrolase family protein [Gammaproteobacteria bacterium]
MRCPAPPRRRRAVTAGLLLIALASPGPARPGTQTLAITEGTNFALDVAPDGTTVIDVQGALFALPADGQAATALTDGFGDDRLPRFSPDGKHVVFQSFRSGDFHLWTVPASGGKPRALTTGPHDDREPAWYPDGRNLAFTSDRNGNLDIWRLDRVNGQIAPVTRNPADDYWPAVAPDGRRIAFVSDRGGSPGLYLQVLDSAGNSPGEAPAERLADGKAGYPSGPRWSPDGRTLAFIRTVDRIGFPAIARFQVVLLDIATRETRILSGPDSDLFPFAPAWLPGGGLAWTADGGIRRWHPDGNIDAQAFAIDLPITTPAYRQKPFTPPAARQAAIGIVEPVAAPDGGVVFAALGDLWWRTPGGELRQLTNDAVVERDPAFSRDGKSLAFISDRGGSMQVWLRNVSTGNDQQVTTVPRGVRYPTFTPDGASLVFQQAGPRGNLDFTLHLLDINAGTVSPIRAPPLWPGRMGISADGQRLLVAALTSTSARFREGRNVLQSIDLKGGAADTVALPDGLTSDAGPVLSPDSRRAALLINGELWLLPLAADGSAEGPPRRRVARLADYPSFSVDGRTLTYLATSGLQQVGVIRGRPRPLPVRLTWAPATGSGSVLIRAGRVFDGVGPHYLRNVDVLVTGNRIVAVGPDLVTPANARVIDARQSTLLPGLIDNHAHHQAHDGAWVGRSWLAFGVTSVVEPGGLPYESRENFEAWASYRRPGPRLFYAGPQLDGRQRFFPFASHIDSDRRLAQELERAQVLGYTLLKTYTRLPVQRQGLAISAGHRLGLPVSSHEIWPAFDLGGDRVEHLRGTSRLGWSSKQSEGLRMYGDATQIIGRSGATIVPTLAVGGGFLDILLRHPELDGLPQYARYYSESDRRNLRALAGLAGRRRALFDAGLANSRQSLRDVVAAGARVIAGTDAPIFPYGLSLLAELRALRDAGLPAAAVLRAATSDAAAAIGAGKQLGRIAPGMLADLVIVGGDPLAEPLELARVEMVFINGVPVSGP